LFFVSEGHNEQLEGGFIMRKSANADISNLFRKFGGDTGSYKEIQQDYIGEKAQQNWPIVQAIEKERVDAPKLKRPAPGVHAAHVQNAGVAQPVFTPEVASSTPASRPLFGGLAAQPAPATNALFGGLAAQPAPATNALFGGLAAQPAPAMNPLFGGLNAVVAPAASSQFSAPSVGVQPSQSTSQVNGSADRANANPLNAVFSRLTNPQKQESLPNNDLRSMLGFLKK
jgi:hypothetical protein